MLIYLAENTITGKRYVGATRDDSVKRRMTEHKSKANLGKKTRFHEAIREHGWESFRWSLLSVCSSAQDMLYEEQSWIEIYDTKNAERGYNMTKGGCGVLGHEVSPETRAKLSVAAKGRLKSEEERRKLSIANKGKRPSDAAFQALLNSERNRDACRRNGLANRGRRHAWSEERLAKMRVANRRRKESDKHGRIPHSHLSEIRARREAGESFASIAATYNSTAPNLFHWLKGRAPS